MAPVQVTPAPVAGKAGKGFSVSISNFLNAIDDDGAGELQLDDLTEIFSSYQEMKNASNTGSIALATLPKEIRPALKVFDVEGDGTVGVAELARAAAAAAELYQDSKNLVRRLTRVCAVLLVLMVMLVGTIVVLTAQVVESSAETEMSSTGITMAGGGGTPPPAAAAGVIQQVARRLLHPSR